MAATQNTSAQKTSGSGKFEGVKTTIHWKKVWGLAILQSSVTLSWMVYFFAQPVLLEAHGFSSFTAYFLVVAGLLSLLVEPLAGLYADRLRKKSGNIFKVINIGVIATALIFFIVALGLQIKLTSTIPWIVPLLMIFWMITMKIFQTPALSLLAGSSPESELPKAAAILTLLGGLIGALDPFLPDAINAAGAPLTFLMGGVLLVVAYIFMRKLGGTFENASPGSGSGATVNSLASDGKALLVVFLTGLLIGVSIFPLDFLIPEALSAATGTLSDGPIISGNATTGILIKPYTMPADIAIKDCYIGALVFLVSAISALPFGNIIAKKGPQKAILTGLSMTTLSFFGAWLAITQLKPISWVHIAPVCIVLGMGISILLNAGIPFVLQRVSSGRASLGVGLFFGGAGLASALLNLLPKTIHPAESASLLSSLGLAAIGIFWISQSVLKEKTAA